VVAAAEIERAVISSELVVLSGCQTAMGRPMANAGIAGLTSALFRAGAARVISTAWNVDDEASAELIGRFYQGLFEKGLPPAAALRQAQLDLARSPRWERPYFWAGYMLHGDWRSMRVR
jgi:CHAT domain-containing protein